MNYLDQNWVAKQIHPRMRQGHKGTFGTLTVLAGSARYRGAAVLSVSSALRTGAGIVRLCSIEKVCATVAGVLPACILYPLPETENGGIDVKNSTEILAEKHTAILAGCGLGNTRETALLIKDVLANAKVPVVLDADGLNVLTGGGPEAGGMLSVLAEKECIITPHIGEMARLCGCTVQEVEQNRQQKALEFAREYRCVVVLKSHETVVAGPTGRCLQLVGMENPGLAKGGSGDVLAGIIGALAAQGYPLETAAGAGVWLHAKAGKIAAEQMGENGLSPADLPRCLCEVWRELGR